MKRIIFTILLSFALFTACSDSSVSEITMQDTYFFRTSHGSKLSDVLISGTLLKINPVTSVATPICTDPLCDHNNEDCPLFGVRSMKISGNMLFLTKGYTSVNAETGEHGGSISLCVYDMQKGTLKELGVYVNDIMFIGAANNYCYFAEAGYSETDGGAVTDYSIYRADGKSGKIIRLPLDKEYQTVGGGMNTGDCPNIYDIENDKIYWSAVSELIITILRIRLLSIPSRANIRL